MVIQQTHVIPFYIYVNSHIVTAVDHHIHIPGVKYAYHHTHNSTPQAFTMDDTKEEVCVNEYVHSVDTLRLIC